MVTGYMTIAFRVSWHYQRRVLLRRFGAIVTLIIALLLLLARPLEPLLRLRSKEPPLLCFVILVAGRREIQLALEVGLRSFRHLCGKERITREKREESSTSKRKKFATGRLPPPGRTPS
jgi:hypothetical protein